MNKQIFILVYRQRNYFLFFSKDILQSKICKYFIFGWVSSQQIIKFPCLVDSLLMSAEVKFSTQSISSAGKLRTSKLSSLFSLFLKCWDVYNQVDSTNLWDTWEFWIWGASSSFDNLSERRRKVYLWYLILDEFWQLIGPSWNCHGSDVDSKPQKPPNEIRPMSTEFDE